MLIVAGGFDHLAAAAVVMVAFVLQTATRSHNNGPQHRGEWSGWGHDSLAIFKSETMTRISRFLQFLHN